MKLFLHIGTEKTGSTSIQGTLLSQSLALSERSILVPQSLLAWRQHAKLYTFFKSTSYLDDFLLFCGLQEPSLRKLTIDAWRQDFEDEIQSSSCSTCIISSELLQSRLSSVDEVQDLGAYLESVFSDVTIVLYIRDPLRLAISLTSTALKSGHSVNSVPMPEDNAFFKMGLDVKCNFQRTVELWKESMPSASLVLRIFDREALDKGCVVLDFFNHIGIPILASTVPPIENKSLGSTGAAILASLNHKLPRINTDMTYNRDRDALISIISDTLAYGSPILPSRQVAQSFQLYFCDSNEWIRSHYFPERASLFGDYCGPFAETDSFTIDPSDVGILSDLILKISKLKATD